GRATGARRDILAEADQVVAVAIEPDLAALERGQRQGGLAEVEPLGRRGGDAAQFRLGPVGVDAIHHEGLSGGAKGAASTGARPGPLPTGVLSGADAGG